jgi:hypothetical protein
MKTIFKISTLFLFLIMGTGAFAQYCDLTINDANNQGDQEYHYIVGLFDFDVSTTNPVEVVNDTARWTYNGSTNPIQFTTQFAPDKRNLYFRAYARNLSNSRSDIKWSGEFDSGQYYSGVNVALDIPQ